MVIHLVLYPLNCGAYVYAVSEFQTLPRNQYLTGLVEGQRPLHLSSTKLSVVQMCFYMNLYMLVPVLDEL